ncbi:RraA family protein [Roseomonas alkaliterrae]|jgi:4-hydroxy-4-methyl-2-oxoglutarate aldolase|uniref:Putative 4-hydroxy-4-methyl-2-oxoglutarate aldolase n=1 Tax=Neoroseomonas alkaliterrae TaxID=1452450 RepID=A0A840Y347_9PROT|nr:RraA family protein [Neoroseomonas alkaliterrae]MBB5690797.1 regulator of RNase E activity RraA [Neoroseomonas alkaliterrae]MBR0675772.1 RraA family protein [Neoroseomonas alkaliterrae]
MLDNPPLITIHRGHRRPGRALVEAFRGAQTSHLVDAMDGRGALDHRIKPMDPANAAFAGPALTALAYPADVVGVYGALWEAEPGDVIVVANDAYAGTAVVGDLVAGMLRNKGVAAFVTDGLARDRAGIVATGLPLFAAGIIPASPAANGPGVVGAPITLGGQHVRPGDIVVGDADGVVIVPRDRAEAVLERLAAVRAAEEQAIAAVAAGATSTERMRAIMAGARVIGP